MSERWPSLNKNRSSELQIASAQREGIGAVRELGFRLPVTVAPLEIVNLNLPNCRPRTCLPIAADD